MSIGQARLIAVIISLAYIPAFDLGATSIWVACMALSAACLFCLRLRLFFEQPSSNAEPARRRADLHRLLRSLALQIAGIASFVSVSVMLAVAFNIMQPPGGSAALKGVDLKICGIIASFIGSEATCITQDFLRISLMHVLGLAALLPFAQWLLGAAALRRAAALLCTRSGDDLHGSEIYYSYIGKRRFAETAMMVFVAAWSAALAFSSTDVDPFACAALQIGLIYFSQRIAIGFCESTALLQQSYGANQKKERF